MLLAMPLTVLMVVFEPMGPNFLFGDLGVAIGIPTRPGVQRGALGLGTVNGPVLVRVVLSDGCRGRRRGIQIRRFQ